MSFPKFIWRDEERLHLLILGQKRGEYQQIIISLEKNTGNLELIEYFKGQEFYHRRVIDTKENLKRILESQLEQGRNQGLKYDIIELEKQGNLDQQICFLADYFAEPNGEGIVKNGTS